MELGDLITATMSGQYPLSHIAILLKTRFSLTVFETGYWMMFMGIIYLISATVLNRIINRHIGFSHIVTYMYGLAALAISMMLISQSKWIFYTMIVLYVVSNVLSRIAIKQLYAGFASKDTMGRIMGLSISVGIVSMVLGSYVGGLLLSFNQSGNYVLVFVMLLHFLASWMVLRFQVK